MKLRMVGWMGWGAGLLGVCLVVGCEKRESRVVVSEVRGVTTKDGALRLDATADERFRDAKPSPVEGGFLPEGWLQRPSTQMRLLNYGFGVDGEVWVSLSQGSVLENVNRWLKQFAEEAITGEELGKLREVDLGKLKGVWVEAKGDYNAGMMAGGMKKNRAMAGVIGKTSRGEILTVKMIGSPEEVEREKGKLEAYCRGLVEK